MAVPVFVYFTLAFFYYAKTSVTNLNTAGNLYLKHGQTVVPPDEFISEYNRKLFPELLFPGLFLLTLLFIFATEMKGYAPSFFGWVQSSFSSEWFGSTLEQLNAKNIQFIEEKFVGVGYGGIKIIGVMGGSGNFPLHCIFLILSLSFQAFFFSYAIWLFLKIAFFLAIIFIGLKNGADGIEKAAMAKVPKSGLPPTTEDTRGIFIQLNFEDENRRFGLGELDKVYNYSSALVFIGSLAFFFQTAINGSKGTSFWSNPNLRMISQPIAILVVVSMLVIIGLIPVSIFGVMTRDSQEKQKRSLMVRKKKLSSQSGFDREMKEIDKGIILADEQRPWPRGDKTYAFLSLGSLALILLPFIGLMDGVPDFVKILFDLPAKATAIFCK